MKQAGLTLFELLVALALLALISAGLAGSLGFAIRLNDRVQASVPLSAPVAARIQLRRFVAHAVPPSLLVPYPATFEGSAATLRFVTLATSGLAPDAAALQVTVSESAETLTMTLVPLDDDGGEGDAIILPLAADASGLVMSYFDTSADSSQWRSDWPADSPTLPRAIRITLDPGSAPIWPDFTARPVLYVPQN